MIVHVQFYSYLRELTGADSAAFDMPAASTVQDLLERAWAVYPAAAAMRNSTLVAIGMEYAERNQPLKQDDEVALFPPVQGG